MFTRYISILCCLASLASANQYYYDEEAVDQDDELGRLFSTNYTSTLVMVNATILAYGLAMIVAVGALVILLYYLYAEGSAADAGAGYSSNGAYTGLNHFSSRSSSAGAFDTTNILKWIQVLSEMYEEFNMNDLDCQKQHFCELLRDPKLFHTRPLAKGMEYAKYLEVIALPDEMRGVLDEMMDAYEVAKGRKDCGEYFYCPYSFAESYKRTFLGNEVN